MRIRSNATLAEARIPMQIDTGCGDEVVPKPVEVEYPAMIKFPPPVLRPYPKGDGGDMEYDMTPLRDGIY